MTNSSIPEDRIPVFVGSGESVDRPKEITEGLEPLDLLEQALRRAEQDAGAKLLGELESLDVVNFLSWRYLDPDLGGARGSKTAMDAGRPRRRGAQARRGIPEAAGGQARRVPARDGLS